MPELARKVPADVASGLRRLRRPAEVEDLIVGTRTVDRAIGQDRLGATQQLGDHLGVTAHSAHDDTIATVGAEEPITAPLQRTLSSEPAQVDRTKLQCAQRHSYIVAHVLQW